MTLPEKFVMVGGLAVLTVGSVWLLCMFQYVIDQIVTGHRGAPDGFRDYATEYASAAACTAADWCDGPPLAAGLCRHHLAARRERRA